MVDRNHMTPMQKTIAYSAIIVGILAVFSAFGTAIHIANYVFTLPVGVCPLDGQWGSWGSWSTCHELSYLKQCQILSEIYPQFAANS